MKTSFILGLSLIVILFSACTEETIINNYYTSAPLDSNWQKCNGPYDKFAFYSLSSAMDNSIYLSPYATSSIFYRSTDEGSNWIYVDYSNVIHFLQATKSVDSYYYALDERLGLYKSTDGLNWSLISHNIINPNGRKNFYYSSYNVLMDGTLILGIGWQVDNDSGRTNFFGEFYKSRDGGNNWSIVMNGSDSLKDVYNIRKATNGYLYIYQRMPTNIDLYYLLCSKDNGLTWFKTSDEPHEKYEQFLSFPDGSVLFAYKGIYKRSDDNGATLIKINNGLFGSRYSVFLGDNNYLYCSTSTGLYRSTNKGDSWEPLLENIGSITSAFRSNTGHIYFILNNAIVYRTKKANMY